VAGSLANPRAKLARAYEHLQTLDREAAEFFATEPYEIVLECDLKARKQVARVKVRNSPDDDARVLRLGCILGDVVANTRNALDSLTHELARFNGAPDTNKVTFPVWARETEASASEVKKALGKLTCAHRTAILNAQPYNAGDDFRKHYICLLAWLVNRDKHRVVHATLGYLTSYPPRFVRFEDTTGRPVPTPSGARLARPPKRLCHRAELASAPATANVVMRVQGDPTCDIAFGSESVRASAIVGIYERVQRFVETFALDFGEQ
jgi:hypothetical protein